MSFQRESVEEVIHRRLDPLFGLDGGEVHVAKVDPDGGEVRVRFGGAYEACPGRSVLLSYVVEPVLREELPAVRRVRIG
mgnify:CR=1 FL=1